MRTSLLPSFGGSPTSERIPSLSGFGFGLLELQLLVGIVDVPVSKVFHVTEAQAAIQAEDERASYVGVLVLIMTGYQPLYFLR